MPANSLHPQTIEALSAQFLLYALAELHHAPETIVKYRDCLRQVVRRMGNLTTSEITKSDLLELKSSFLASNLSVARQVTILLALKRFLRYAHEELQLPVKSEPSSSLIVRLCRPGGTWKLEPTKIRHYSSRSMESAG